MNLNKKVKIQQLEEQNGKILDLNNIEFILSNYEEYQVLADLIRKSSQYREIKRILIISDNLIKLYSHLSIIFPKAQFFIANKSKEVLK